MPFFVQPKLIYVRVSSSDLKENLCVCVCVCVWAGGGVCGRVGVGGCRVQACVMCVSMCVREYVCVHVCIIGFQCSVNVSGYYY